MTSYFSFAVPVPPLMMAPAWPMRRPGGRRLAGDEADHGLAHMLANELRGLLLGIAADLADHDDGVRVGVVIEQANGIEERRADDGIAADADAGGLADAEVRELADGFVGQACRCG